MAILNRIGFRFALIGTVLAVISVFAHDSHKLQEVARICLYSVDVNEGDSVTDANSAKGKAEGSP